MKEIYFQKICSDSKYCYVLTSKFYVLVWQEAISNTKPFAKYKNSSDPALKIYSGINCVYILTKNNKVLTFCHKTHKFIALNLPDRGKIRKISAHYDNFCILTDTGEIYCRRQKTLIRLGQNGTKYTDIATGSKYIILLDDKGHPHIHTKKYGNREKSTILEVSESGKEKKIIKVFVYGEEETILVQSKTSLILAEPNEHLKTNVRYAQTEVEDVVVSGQTLFVKKESGLWYAAGRNDEYQLGIKNFARSGFFSEPEKIIFSGCREIIKIFPCHASTYLITKDGEVHVLGTFGKKRASGLFSGFDVSVWTPQDINFLKFDYPYVEARRLYEKKLYKEVIECLKKRSFDYKRKFVWGLRGDCYFFLKKYKEAASEYEKQGRYDGFNSLDVTSRINWFFCLFELKKYEKALGKAEHLSSKSTTYKIELTKGYCHYHLKSFPDAIKYYEQALQINSEVLCTDTLKMRLNLGYLLVESDPNKAIAHFEFIVKYKEKWLDAYKGLGLGYYYSKKYLEAIKMFEKYKRKKSDMLDMVYVSAVADLLNVAISLKNDDMVVPLLTRIIDTSFARILITKTDISAIAEYYLVKLYSKSLTTRMDRITAYQKVRGNFLHECIGKEIYVKKMEEIEKHKQYKLLAKNTISRSKIISAARKLKIKKENELLKNSSTTYPKPDMPKAVGNAVTCKPSPKAASKKPIPVLTTSNAPKILKRKCPKNGSKNKRKTKLLLVKKLIAQPKRKTVTANTNRSVRFRGSVRSEMLLDILYFHRITKQNQERLLQSTSLRLVKQICAFYKISGFPFDVSARCVAMLYVSIAKAKLSWCNDLERLKDTLIKMLHKCTGIHALNAIEVKNLFWSLRSCEMSQDEFSTKFRKFLWNAIYINDRFLSSNHIKTIKETFEHFEISKEKMPPGIQLILWPKESITLSISQLLSHFSNSIHVNQYYNANEKIIPKIAFIISMYLGWLNFDVRIFGAALRNCFFCRRANQVDFITNATKQVMIELAKHYGGKHVQAEHHSYYTFVVTGIRVNIYATQSNIDRYLHELCDFTMDLLQLNLNKQPIYVSARHNLVALDALHNCYIDPCNINNIFIDSEFIHRTITLYLELKTFKEYAKKTPIFEDKLYERLIWFVRSDIEIKKNFLEPAKVGLFLQQIFCNKNAVLFIHYLCVDKYAIEHWLYQFLPFCYLFPDYGYSSYDLVKISNKIREIHKKKQEGDDTKFVKICAAFLWPIVEERATTIKTTLDEYTPEYIAAIIEPFRKYVPEQINKIIQILFKKRTSFELVDEA